MPMMLHHDCPTLSNAIPDVLVCPAPLEISQMSTLEYLEKLLAFDSTSAHPNAGLIDWVQAQVGVNGTDHLIQL
tara:strand:- start:321 stop:542 length:222 start_codon:yes stop_codon:yes gene_type:complete